MFILTLYGLVLCFYKSLQVIGFLVAGHISSLEKRDHTVYVTGSEKREHFAHRLFLKYQQVRQQLWTASSRSCAITSQKTRNAPVDFHYYEGVALMEEHSIVQLSNVISFQVLLVITTCVYIPELHYYAKSQILTRLSTCTTKLLALFYANTNHKYISHHTTIRIHFTGKYAFYR